MVDIVYTPLNEGKPEIYPIVKPKIRWEDLILLYGTRICASETSTGANETKEVYAVPEGKVFFLLTANLSVGNNAAVRKSGRIFIRRPGESTTNTRTMMTISAMPQGQNGTSISPVVPLLVVYGEKVALFNDDALVNTAGQVCGYEIGTDLFQTLF
jgi:hypothetical protein